MQHSYFISRDLQKYFFFCIMFHGKESFVVYFKSVTLLRSFKHNKNYIYIIKIYKMIITIEICYVQHSRKAYKGTQRQSVILWSMKRRLRRILMMLLFYIHNEINIIFWGTLKYAYGRIWDVQHLSFIYRVTCHTKEFGYIMIYQG